MTDWEKNARLFSIYEPVLERLFEVDMVVAMEWEEARELLETLGRVSFLGEKCRRG